MHSKPYTGILGRVQFKRIEVTHIWIRPPKFPPFGVNSPKQCISGIHLRRKFRLSERASFSFGRIQSTVGLPEMTRPVVGERGHIVVLQLKPIPFIEQFFGKKKVSSGSYPIGGVSAIDLTEEPAVLLPNPFDALVLYITQAALDEVAYAHRAPRVAAIGVAAGSV